MYKSKLEKPPFSVKDSACATPRQSKVDLLFNRLRLWQKLALLAAISAVLVAVSVFFVCPGIKNITDIMGKISVSYAPLVWRTPTLIQPTATEA